MGHTCMNHTVEYPVTSRSARSRMIAKSTWEKNRNRAKMPITCTYTQWICTIHRHVACEYSMVLVLWSFLHIKTNAGSYVTSNRAWLCNAVFHGYAKSERAISSTCKLLTNQGSRALEMNSLIPVLQKLKMASAIHLPQLSILRPMNMVSSLRPMCMYPM